MTKEKAIQALKARAVGNIKKTEDVDSTMQFPDDFQSFLANAKKHLEDVKMLKASGVSVVNAGLRLLSDSDIQTVKEIMDTSGYAGRRGSSEERVLKAVDVMFPRMAMLENAKLAISKMQDSMTAEFVSIYADEYHCYVSGSATFDNVSFMKSIDKEIGVRAELQARSHGSVQVQSEGQGQNCTIF